MGWEDDRAVSEVLGAMLLFGIIVLAIGGYQAFVVPQQNAEIEHEHDMQINDEFPAIQEAISNAAASGKQRTTSLSLGKDYPSRVFAMGVPTATGNLKTGPEGTISIDGHDLQDTCGVEPKTRSIKYRANYHELDDTGQFVYEHGVTYRLYDGRAVERTNQELISDNTIRLYPITNGDFDRTSSASEQIRFKPAKTGIQEVSVGSKENIVLKLPTELSKGEWKSLLAGEVPEENVDVKNGNVQITLGEGDYRFACTPVGINDEPEQGFVPTESKDEGSDGLKDINPRDGTVHMKDSTINGEKATITLENADTEDWTITQARIPFVLANGDPTYADYDGNQIDRLYIGDRFEPVSHTTLESNQDITITLKFDDTLMTTTGAGKGPQFDPLFILSIQIEQDSMIRFQTYFITQ